jgi:uncharacterized repeat protein (TIGR03803 family)
VPTLCYSSANPEIEKEENPVQRKKWFATLGVLRCKVLGYGRRGAALTIVIATLTLARGAAGSQLGAKPDRAGAYNILHLFTWAKLPTGNLIFDAEGNLYGTTSDGGSGSGGGCCGAVWKLTRNPKGTWTVSILHAFTGGADGAAPYAGVILDATGNLYGTTSSGGSGACPGCGVVFKLAPNPDGTWTESVLHNFTFGGADGRYPAAGLTFDAAGDLYGTTEAGGTYNGGVVFELEPNPDGTWTESVLYSLDRNLGAQGAPGAGLIFDGAGNLYGTTNGNGESACDCGTVFKLAPNPEGTWTGTVLYSFTGGADGGGPSAGLIFDAAGNLYGTTEWDGADGRGVVFKLAPNPDETWTESVLYSFTGGADGAYPFAGLVFDAAGNLYGTTFGGGTYSAFCRGFGCGVVFKLSPSSSGWSETVLHTFIGFGKYPQGGVIFDPAGNLYGTTNDGNHAYNYGLVFEITR